MLRSRLIGLGAFLLAVGAASAEAHQFAPSLLELRELEPGRAAVLWKQPATRVLGSQLQPVVPSECSGIGTPSVEREGTGFVARWEIACGSSLVGKTLGVEGLAMSRAGALLRVELADGRSYRHVLTADQPSFVVPEEEGKLDVMRGYTGLGVEHILSGWDHLLFVLALVLLVGWDRKLLWTVTAFTLGHSLTLALAGLGLVHVPQAPVEAAIAASIFFLAVELTRQNASGELSRLTLVERAPWLVAGGFGLLHGLGFAGALSNVGLPQGEIPLALFAFNVGIEVGQLAFVALVLVLWLGSRALPIRLPEWLILVPAYGIGSLAVYWVLERLAGILPGQV